MILLNHPDTCKPSRVSSLDHTRGQESTDLPVCWSVFAPHGPRCKSLLFKYLWAGYAHTVGTSDLTLCLYTSSLDRKLVLVKSTQTFRFPTPANLSKGKKTPVEVQGSFQTNLWSLKEATNLKTGWEQLLFGWLQARQLEKSASTHTSTGHVKSGCLQHV